MRPHLVLRMTPEEWCPASGSYDEYLPQEEADYVICFECNRSLYLTKKLQIPWHKKTQPKWKGKNW